MRLFHKNTTIALLILASLAPVAMLEGCSKHDGLSAASSDDEAHFRHRWWNYYQRGSMRLDNGLTKKAEQDLLIAIEKRSQDSRMARTYGMHFIDYFPHRELGVAYFSDGRMADAERELQISLDQYPSAKASFYLNKVRQRQLQQSGKDTTPPQLTMNDGEVATLTNALSVTLKGEASDDFYVSRLMVAGKPVRIEQATPKLSFSRDVPLQAGVNEIVVEAFDLVNQRVEKRLHIVSDRQAPQLSIADINVGVDAQGHSSVTLKGSVWDANGVKELTIGGQKVEADSATGAFSIVLQGRKESEFTFIAVDKADNRAEGTIRADGSMLSKSEFAFRAPAEYALLAGLEQGILSDVSSGMLLASAGGRAPQMRLEGLGRTQEVFWDRVFIEGKAADDSLVTDILVNGQSVLRNPGKQVFFSSMIPLNVGNNDIRIETMDDAGSKSTEAVSIVRKQMEVKRIGKRLRLSQLPLEVKGDADSAAELVPDNLLDALVQQKRFQMVERAKLESILREQKLAASDLADPATAARVGKLATAQLTLIGSVMEMKQGMEVVARVVDTETSEIVASADVFDTEKSLFSVQDMMEGLALKLNHQFPLIGGYLVKRDGDKAYIDLGTDAGVHPGMWLMSYREGEPIVHPITGKKLGADSVITGELKITHSESDFSICEVLSESDKDVMAQMDQVLMH